MRPLQYFFGVVIATPLGLSNAQSTKEKDCVAGLANSNPTVSKKISDEKRQDDATSSLHDAATGPAVSSGAVQRSQKAMVDETLD